MWEIILFCSSYSSKDWSVQHSVLSFLSLQCSNKSWRCLHLNEVDYWGILWLALSHNNHDLHSMISLSPLAVPHQAQYPIFLWHSQTVWCRKLAKYSVHFIIGSTLLIFGTSDKSSPFLLTNISHYCLKSLMIGSHCIMLLVMALPNVLYNITRFESASNIIYNFSPNLNDGDANITPPRLIWSPGSFRFSVNCLIKSLSTISKSSTSLIPYSWSFTTVLCYTSMLLESSKNFFVWVLVGGILEEFRSIWWISVDLVNFRESGEFC